MAFQIDTIRSAAQRVAASHGLDVVDVEYQGDPKHRTLRIFIEKNAETRARLVAEGLRVLGDGAPKTGAHGKPVLFLHPKDFCGTLIELEQA